jgi:hypothetical protein
MFANLKHKLFPCERIMKRLMDSHAESVRKNNEAHEKLLTVCNEKTCKIKDGEDFEVMEDVGFFNLNVSGAFK